MPRTPFGAFVEQLAFTSTVVEAAQAEGRVTVTSLEDLQLSEPLTLHVPDVEIQAAIARVSDEDRAELWPDSSPQMAGIFTMLVDLETVVRTAKDVPRRVELRGGRFVVTS